MSRPNLEELLSDGIRPSASARVTGLPPDVQAARKSEQTRRENAARYMAWKALVRLHPDDYKALKGQADRKIRAESGPLPGDRNGDDS